MASPLPSRPTFNGGTRTLDTLRLPKGHLTRTKDSAVAFVNARNVSVEAPVRRQNRTAGVNQVVARQESGGELRRQFSMVPGHMHFGRVQLGTARRKRATLTNVSHDLGRFYLKQPGPPLRVDYSPGAVPAGMSASFDVHFTALARAPAAAARRCVRGLR